MEKTVQVICERIDALLQQREWVVVAIDGSCTAGKSTLAAKLESIYDCNVFHMDDFFLRPHQRTPERFGETGGNVDYERFQEEVLLPLLEGKRFSYRPFDCKRFELAQPVSVTQKKLNIVEGSYCLHPFFGDVYDLKILLTVDEETQKARVEERPANLHQRFFEQWIPMENRYFEETRIRERVDMIL